MSDKQRIIDLQRQVRIARTALEKIVHSSTDPVNTAEEALDEMRRQDKPAPLAGVLGWEGRRP